MSEAIGSLPMYLVPDETMLGENGPYIPRYLYRKRRGYTETLKEDRGRGESDVSRRQRTPKIASNHQKLGRVNPIAFLFLIFLFYFFVAAPAMFDSAQARDKTLTLSNDPKP